MRSETENRGNVKTLSKAFLAKWAQRQKTTNHIQHSLLLTLVTRADGRGQCSLSANDLAKIAHLSRRSVITGLNELERAGIITRIEHTRGDGSRGRNTIALRCTSCTTPSARHALPPPCTTCTPLGNVDISTNRDRFVLEDRYHLDNRPEYLDEGVSEGDWDYGLPPPGTLLCDAYDDEVPA